ncbi:hypothetical protein [Amycolatopsis sp. WGS_07]|uniref:hypothetical protein n=1 Tax=Amycolatopsis sp. WGS_07 TaxID=3076764 RepID=UPI0038732786
MPGFLLHSGMTMTCPHGGAVTAIPAGPPAALVNGMPVLTTKDQMVVVGCTLTPPCATVQWTNISSLLAGGTPVLTQVPPAGQGGGTCVGSLSPGPPIVIAMQPFVTGR